MDKVIPQEVQNKNQRRSYIPIAIIIAVILVSYFGLRSFLKKSGKINDFHIVRVEKGNVKETLTATGIIVPASERTINAPVVTEIKDVLLTSGDKVKKGDLILLLDQEYTSLEYERLEDQLSLRKNNIEKLKLEFDKNLRDLDYQDQIKALQLSELQAQVIDQERLLKIGGATEEELEAAKLNLDIAKIEKKLLENDLQFKRQVNTNDKNNLQLEYDIEYKNLKVLKRKLSETNVRATGDGVITWVNKNIGKTVAQGEALVRIANLDHFEVEASTSDRNSKQLAIGLPVELRINKEKIYGTISRILPEIKNNTVKFYVELDKVDHQSLRPNLRTELYIITNEREDVLRAKRGGALKGTQSQYVFKVENQNAIKTRITKGLISSDYFEIKEGLNVGDQIIISETKEFDHMEQFQLIPQNK